MLLLLLCLKDGTKLAQTAAVRSAADLAFLEGGSEQTLPCRFQATGCGQQETDPRSRA